MASGVLRFVAARSAAARSSTARDGHHTHVRRRCEHGTECGLHENIALSQWLDEHLQQRHLARHRRGARRTHIAPKGIEQSTIGSNALDGVDESIRIDIGETGRRHG